MWKRKHESGQAMVEFALLLPLFLILTFGIIEFGCYFSFSLSVTSAAREGARYGVTHSSDSDFVSGVTSRVQSCAPNLEPANMTVDVTKKSDSGEEDVFVDIDYAADTITPVGKILWGSQYHVKSSCTMKIN